MISEAPVIERARLAFWDVMRRASLADIMPNVVLLGHKFVGFPSFLAGHLKKYPPEFAIAPPAFPLYNPARYEASARFRKTDC
jgi:hypothetical protein